MITLQDYIGKIYKDITNAKVQSDIETLAIANEYVNNPLLKHFSVPNIRIKNLELTIPVAVDNTQPTTNYYTEREVRDVYYNAFETAYLSFRPDKGDFIEAIKVDLTSKAEATATTATRDLKQAQIEDEQQAQMQEPTTETQTAESPESTTSSQNYGVKYSEVLQRISVEFADATFSFVEGDLPREEFYPVLTEAIEAALPPREATLETLPVIVETSRLKQIDDPTSLMNIKVTITDDAMEWTTDIDADGNPIQVLNYE